MIVNAVRPEWAPIVEQAARQMNTDGLPPLHDELGRGWYYLRYDGFSKASLYWERANGHAKIRQRIGGWEVKPVEKVKHINRQTGALTEGWTPEGWRIMRVRCSEQSDQTLLFAVVYEEYRGVRLPRPVPYGATEVQR
jgi:hypothetical protein